MFDYILKGGLLMWPLLILSMYTLAIIIYKTMQLKSCGAFNSNFTDHIVSLLKNRKMRDAEAFIKENEGTLSNVVSKTISVLGDETADKDIKEAEIENHSYQEYRKLESFQKGLELVASVSPLIGLLGTVIGMVKAFARIADTGSRVSPSLLAEGIWEALITTVAGLLVAVPALIAYYVFESFLEKAKDNINTANVKITKLYS